ncbi:MAG: hypothetical protein H6Q70_3617 [Firmicutes bacterium]|nr:hypothetical protein [Bacillota bacterium]
MQITVQDVKNNQEALQSFNAENTTESEKQPIPYAFNQTAEAESLNLTGAVASSSLDPSRVDWSKLPTVTILDFGPFTIDADLHIDQENILDSQFFLRVYAKVPVIGKIKIIDTCIDRNKPSINGSIDGFSAKIELDMQDMENMALRAELSAFGSTWKVTIWHK